MKVIGSWIYSGCAIETFDAGFAANGAWRRLRLPIFGGKSFHSSGYRGEKLPFVVERLGKNGENRRFWHGQGYLQSGLLSKGRKSHAARQMDATRSLFGRNFYNKNWCLVIFWIRNFLFRLFWFLSIFYIKVFRGPYVGDHVPWLHAVSGSWKSGSDAIGNRRWSLGATARVPKCGLRHYEPVLAYAGWRKAQIFGDHRIAAAMHRSMNKFFQFSNKARTNFSKILLSFIPQCPFFTQSLLYGIKNNFLFVSNLVDC